MRQLLLIAIAYAIAAVSHATEIPPQVPLGTFVRVPLAQDERAFVVATNSLGRVIAVDVLETKDGIAFTGMPGYYSVFLFSTTSTGQQQLTTRIICPPPDVKPDPKPEPPKPDPKPDDPPKPDQIPAPIPGQGLRVVILYESKAVPPIVPRGQYDAMFNGTVREWLTRNCAVSPSNVAEWRMIDPDGIVASTPEPWKTAAARPRGALPWIIISNGTTNKGFEGPVPESADALLKLLQEYKTP